MPTIMVEELETVAVPDSDFLDFLAGVGAGIAIGLLLCGGA